METQNGVPVGSADTETVADVMITIRDVNDEPPTFNRREYRASVPENVPDGTPLPNLDMFVQDTDVVRMRDFVGRFLCREPVVSLYVFWFSFSFPLNFKVILIYSLRGFMIDIFNHFCIFNFSIRLVFFCFCFFTQYLKPFLHILCFR